MRSRASAPTPLMPLPFLIVTMPVRVSPKVWRCVPFAPCTPSRSLAAPAPSPTLASTVPFSSSTSSTSVGGRPSRTRPIMVFHAATSSCSYQVSFLYSLMVGSMAE